MLERPVLVAVDMHRGHLDPAVATLPLPADRSRALIARSAPIFEAIREAGIPVVQVVTIYRMLRESESNPFWAGSAPRRERARTSTISPARPGRTSYRSFPRP